MRISAQDLRIKILSAFRWAWDTVGETLGACWDRFTDKPIDTVMVALVLFALGAFTTAKVLKWTSPKNTLIVASFEIPTAAPPVVLVPVTGKTIADLLKDDISAILEDAQARDPKVRAGGREEEEFNIEGRTPRNSAVSPFGSIATPSVPASSSPTLGDTSEVPQVGLEVQGVSLEKLVEIYSAIRQDRHQIQGNVLLFDQTQLVPIGCQQILGSTQAVVLKSRIDGVGEWTTCPFNSNVNGLRQGTDELAQKIMEDFAGRTLGLAYLKRGRTEDSIRIFRKLTAKDPEDVSALEDLAFAQYMKSDFAGAIAQYRDVLALNPKDLERVHNNLGLALYSNGQIEEAISEYHRAIDLKDGYPDPHNNLGRALWDRDFAQARKEFQLAVQIDPNDADGHDNLGRALDFEFKPKAAIAEYRRAIHLRPGKAEFHGDLGWALDRRGDLDGALTEHGEALRLEPNVWWTHTNFGGLLAEMGDFDRAFAEHQAALNLKGDEPGAHSSFAWMLESEGRYNEAIKEYRAALEVEPNFTEARIGLARVLKRLEDSQSPDTTRAYEAAIANYQEAIARATGPDAALAEREYANAFAEQDSAVALDHLQAALRIRPEPETYNALGYFYFVDHEYDQAAADFRLALLLGPDDTDAHAGLGEVFEAKGRRMEAVGEYRQALVSNPNNAYAKSHLANVFELLTDFDSATRERQNALAEYTLLANRRPHDVDVRKQLGGLLSEVGDYAAAVEQFDLVLTEIPQDAEAHNGRGFALEGLGRQEEAAQEYRNALGIPNLAKGSYVQYRTNLGNLLDNEGNHVEALKTYGETLASFPEDAWTRLNVGVVYVEERKFAEAIAEFDKGLRGADFADFHTARCHALNDKGDYESAIEACQIALTSLPHDSYAHVYLGDALDAKSRNCRWCLKSSASRSAAQQYMVAVNDTKRQLMMKPDADVQYLLGRALLSAHLPGAVDELERALQLRPNFPLADCWLAQALSQSADADEAARAEKEYARAQLLDPLVSPPCR